MGAIKNPLSPTQTLSRLPSLLAPLRLRPARKQAIMALLAAMLRSANFQMDGLIAHVSGSTIQPKTLAELASMAGISYPRAKRAMTDLYKLDWVCSGQLRKRGPAPKTLAVSAGLRFFTPIFWRKLCLGYYFEKAVKQAKERGKYSFSLPLKQVAYRWPITTFSSAKNLISKWKSAAQKHTKRALKQAQCLLFGNPNKSAPPTRPTIPPPAARPAPPPIEAPPPEMQGNERAKAWAELIRARLRLNQK